MKKIGYFKIGFLLILSLILLGIMIYMVENLHFGQGGYYYFAIFDNAGGIEIGSPVQVGGVKMGEVEDVDFIEQNNRILIKLKLWINSKAKLKKDSQITIDLLGFLGEKFISITTGSAKSEILQPGSTVYGISPFRMNQVLEDISATVSDFNQTIDKVNSILEEANVKKHISTIVQNLSNISNSLQAMVEEEKGTFHNTMKNFNEASKNLNNTMAVINKIVSANQKNIASSTENFNKFTKKINTILNKNEDSLNNIIVNINSVSDNLADISSNLQKGKGLLGSILKNPEFEKKFFKIVDNFENFSSDIKRHPWKLLRKSR